MAGAGLEARPIKPAAVPGRCNNKSPSGSRPRIWQKLRLSRFPPGSPPVPPNSPRSLRTDYGNRLPLDENFTFARWAARSLKTWIRESRAVPLRLPGQGRNRASSRVAEPGSRPGAGG